VHLEARIRFAKHGYGGATIRPIAADAGVDPALVHHNYETKEELFVATRFPATEQSAATGYQHRQDATRRGDRADVVRHLGLGGSQEREPVVGILRSAVANEGAARMLREFMSDTILNVLAQTAERDEAAFRASLVASQVVGLLMARFVLELEPSPPQASKNWRMQWSHLPALPHGPGPVNRTGIRGGSGVPWVERRRRGAQSRVESAGWSRLNRCAGGADREPPSGPRAPPPAGVR
jgi:AcrR family transcriptional regulator